MKITIEYTAEEKNRIISALRAAAVAEAQLWDVLHEIENDHECMIETDIYLIGSLAGDCSSPPSFSDLDAENVWESFEFHSEVSL